MKRVRDRERPAASRTAVVAAAAAADPEYPVAAPDSSWSAAATTAGAPPASERNRISDRDCDRRSLPRSPIEQHGKQSSPSPNWHLARVDLGRLDAASRAHWHSFLESA